MHHHISVKCLKCTPEVKLLRHFRFGRRHYVNVLIHLHLLQHIIILTIIVHCFKCFGYKCKGIILFQAKLFSHLWSSSFVFIVFLPFLFFLIFVTVPLEVMCNREIPSRFNERHDLNKPETCVGNTARSKLPLISFLHHFIVS